MHEIAGAILLLKIQKGKGSILLKANERRRAVQDTHVQPIGGEQGEKLRDLWAKAFVRSRLLLNRFPKGSPNWWVYSK